MASMQLITLSHLSANPLYIGYFRNVQNVSFLRDQLLTGNPDYEYAFVDASAILSAQHVLAACFRAINDLNAGRLRTRNVHSETVFSLSPNNNIAESFRRFGLADKTKHVIAIKVGMPTTPNVTEQTVRQHMTTNIRGTLVAFSDAALSETCDVASIRKLYKITDLRPDQAKSRKHQKQNNDDINHQATSEKNIDEIRELESVVLGTMALKGS
ncbi:MAG: hypothetical protein M1821_001965 [Bathelium mastoideum]|nr:MAG: hypothetical protein M1821_001965 [Bathelium mastoideum]